MISNSRFSVIFFLLFFSSCKLTEASVTGKYAGTGLSGMNDTLTVYSNKTFTLETIRDSLEKTISGSWSINNKCLMLDLGEHNEKLFGSCSSICYWNRLLTRKKLIRPITCNIPTHHFTTYTKFE